MQRIDDHLTELLFDPWEFLGPKRKKALETSWAHLFRRHLLTSIPIQTLASRFSQTMGRPTKEIYAMIGALLLQQIFNLTDEQTLHEFMFNQLWHYALDIHDQSDDSMYLCERTLRNYRRILIELESAEELFNSLTAKLLQTFHVPTENQRLDSTHLFSNMKHLQRLDVFVETIEDFLRELRRTHERIFLRDVPPEMAKRYLEKKPGCFSRLTGEEARKTLPSVAEDVLQLVRRFESHPDIPKWETFGLLQRLLREQCRVEPEGSEEQVLLKEPKEIQSTSLQNPSDPDATYDGHKGQGYQAQMMETFQEGEPTAPNLIIYVKVEPAHEPDSGAAIPAMAETQARGCAPERIVADTAYGSDENVQAAAAQGIELIAPVPGKAPKAEEMLVLRDFAVDPETREIVRCPAGEAPLETATSAAGVHSARFDAEKCRGCEHNEYCQVGLDFTNGRIEYTDKQLRLEERRKLEETPEFQAIYRMRSGIEATNSHLKCNLNYGRIRVRGLAEMRFVVTLKALGVNLMRAWHWAKMKGWMGKEKFFGLRIVKAVQIMIQRWGWYTIFSCVCPTDSPTVQTTRVALLRAA
jgi:hypothetical protein